MKTLTEELIQERLEDKGWSVPHETDQEDKISKLKHEYEFSIVNDWQNCDAYFYSDTTTDGYEVWIATEREDRININEDVYYYQSQWFEKLADYLRDGCMVYIDSYSQDEYEFEEIIEAMYEELYMEIHGEVEDELREEGYVDEDFNASKSE
jgi:hypothetical protein